MLKGECALLYMQSKYAILPFWPYQYMGKTARPTFLDLPDEVPRDLPWSLNCQAQAVRFVPSRKLDYSYNLFTFYTPVQSEPPIDPYWSDVTALLWSRQTVQ